MNRWRTSRIKSFWNAAKGIVYNLHHEPNFLIQLIIAVLVVAAGIFFSLRRIQWVFVILMIGSVLSAEAMNTAIEKICDRFFEDEDPRVKIIKNSAAAAVLIISASAFMVGFIIFWPYVKALFVI